MKNTLTYAQAGVMIRELVEEDRVQFVREQQFGNIARGKPTKIYIKQQ